jgi:hypothetical protein
MMCPATLRVAEVRSRRAMRLSRLLMISDADLLIGVLHLVKVRDHLRSFINDLLKFSHLYLPLGTKTPHLWISVNLLSLNLQD